MNNPLAGQTKNVQNYISANYSDGHTEILFTPPAPFETPMALDRICEEYTRIGQLVITPMVIADFVTELGENGAAIDRYRNHHQLNRFDNNRKGTYGNMQVR